MPGVNPDSFRLGPISQTVKRRATPAQWKKIVKDAHAKGFAVESYLDRSVPNEYKARTKESLKAQATSTLTQAYAPAEKLLNEREGRINALSAKRKQDNEFYMDWLTKTRSSMQASANASDQALRASAQKIHEDAVAAHQAGIQQGADRLMAQPGNVTSREELVKSLEISPENIRRLEMINNQRTAIESNASNSQRHRDAQDANVIAQQAAVQAAQSSEAWKSLVGVGEDKLKLQTEKASGVATELTRLLNQEIEKAGANRDFEAVAEKLGIQGKALDLKAIVEASKEEDRETDNDLAAARLAETKRRNSAIEAIDNLRIAQSAERLKISWYTARKKKYEKDSKGKDGKGHRYEDTAEGRFYKYYGALSQTQKADGSKVSAKDVQRNPSTYKKLLLAQGLTPKMASRIIEAYTVLDGKDPATYYAQFRDPKPNGG